jgi:putative endonuclease
MWYIYILRLSNDALYTGITNSIERRMKVHASKKGSKYVRAHLPFQLIYVEPAENKSAALKRESVIKKMNHNKKLEIIKENDNGKVSY